MEASHTDWLRKHMRDHIANYSAFDSAENVLSFGRQPNSETGPGAAALNLVYQAADLIRDVDNYAAERQSRAETLAQQAIEKLKIAHDCVRSEQSGRLAAEAKIKAFSDRLENEINVRLQDVEKVMQQTTSRMAVTEAQLSIAEQRAKAAEMRANEAEDALKRIEDAIRTRILEKRLSDSNRTTARAA
jgi:hypothetical protein